MLVYVSKMMVMLQCVSKMFLYVSKMLVMCKKNNDNMKIQRFYAS